MPLDDMSQEPFAFWIAREFLVADESTEGEYLSDPLTVLTGVLLFTVVVLLGFITRANS
jgi:hypothetical protein